MKFMCVANITTTADGDFCFDECFNEVWRKKKVNVFASSGQALIDYGGAYLFDIVFGWYIPGGLAIILRSHGDFLLISLDCLNPVV